MMIFKPATCIFALNITQLNMKKTLIISILLIPLVVSTQTVSELYNEGLTYFKAEQYEIAIEKFSKALEKDEYFHEAYYYHGRSLYELKQYEEAKEKFSDAIKQQEDFYPAWYYRGKTHQTTKEYNQALKDYDKAIEINPKLAIAYIQRAKIYDLQGNRSKALDNYNKNEELAGGSYELHYNRALLLKRMGKYENALSDALKAINYKPEAKDPFILRANIFRQKQQFGKAKKEFQNLLDINPNSERAYEERAKMYQDLGEYKKALADLETLTNKFDRRDLDIEYQKGICYAHTGNELRARQAFTKVITRNSNYADAYAQRAYVYLEMKKESMAKHDLRQALRKEDNNPTALYLMGKLQVNDSQFEKALENLNKALKNKHIGEAYALRAKCNHHLKNHEQACSDLKLAIVFGYDKKDAQRKMRIYCK